MLTKEEEKAEIEEIKISEVETNIMLEEVRKTNTEIEIKVIGRTMK